MIEYVPCQKIIRGLEQRGTKTWFRTACLHVYNIINLGLQIKIYQSQQQKTMNDWKREKQNKKGIVKDSQIDSTDQRRHMHSHLCIYMYIHLYIWVYVFANKYNFNKYNFNEPFFELKFIFQFSVFFLIQNRLWLNLLSSPTSTFFLWDVLLGSGEHSDLNCYCFRQMRSTCVASFPSMSTIHTTRFICPFFLLYYFVGLCNLNGTVFRSSKGLSWCTSIFFHQDPGAYSTYAAPSITVIRGKCCWVWGLFKTNCISIYVCFSICVCG